MKFAISALAAVSVFAVAPASAATVVFSTLGSPTTTAATQSVTADGITANFTGGVYTGSVAAMNAADGNVALAARTVQKSSTGLGVAQDGEANQIDSNGANELLQVVFSAPGNFRIVSVTVGMVDNTDTFALFGGQNGTYTRLGFTGAIQSGITGGIPVTRTNLGGGNYRLDFNYGGGFDSFRFGTNDEEADGYSLRSLSVAAVPEPSAWALLILGFGLTGAALRRRTRDQGVARAALNFG